MDLTRFKTPLGSLIVDGSLVVALIWWGSGVTATLDNINVRVTKTEATLDERQTALQRLAVAEAQIIAVAKSQEELKSDIVKRLERIEAKLDRR